MRPFTRFRLKQCLRLFTPRVFDFSRYVTEVDGSLLFTVCESLFPYWSSSLQTSTVLGLKNRKHLRTFINGECVVYYTTGLEEMF